jgi:Rieske Fe-S protein
LARRRFLALLGCATANACTVGGVPSANVGDVPSGVASALSVGSLNTLSGEPVCIGRDTKGIYAMTLVCTHQGCDIGQSGTVGPRGIYCGCHGSEFDVDGNVVRGPAASPLAHFAVSADASGNLTVHTATEVDPSTRLSVG